MTPSIPMGNPLPVGVESEWITSQFSCLWLDSSKEYPTCFSDYPLWDWTLVAWFYWIYLLPVLLSHFLIPSLVLSGIAFQIHCQYLSQYLIFGEPNLRYITTSIVQPHLDPIHSIDPTVFPLSLTASSHVLISFPTQFRFHSTWL